MMTGHWPDTRRTGRKRGAFFSRVFSVFTETTEDTTEGPWGCTHGQGTFSGEDGAPLRELTGRDEWMRLPQSVRRRFERAFLPGHVTCYRGAITSARMSVLGWSLAQLARCVGSPLPLHSSPGPVVVTVTDHAGNAGQVWNRQYHRQRGFAQCIQSVKRYRGPTGLEEYLGRGFAFALRLSTTPRALIFTSAGYCVYLFGVRIRIPDWATPGRLTVVHEELAAGRFSFEMTLRHPRFGELLHQRVVFEEDLT